MDHHGYLAWLYSAGLDDLFPRTSEIANGFGLLAAVRRTLGKAV